MFDIHYSSTKSKTFRQFPLEFRQARLTLLKDLKVSLTVLVQYMFKIFILALSAFAQRTSSPPPPRKYLFAYIKKHLFKSVYIIVDHIIFSEIRFQAIINVIVHILLNIPDLENEFFLHFQLKRFTQLFQIGFLLYRECPKSELVLILSLPTLVPFSDTVWNPNKRLA